MREASVQISGRKEPGYPTVSHTVQFSEVDDLLIKIDALIENTDWRKVDVAIQDEDQFSGDEANRLEDEFISLV